MGSKLDALIVDINKRAKEEILTRGMSDFDYQRISFTSPRMNYMTYGGLPMGRIIEFFGAEGSGKTTTCLDIVANYQNMCPDREVLFVDAENTYDIEWATKLGVDTDKLLIMQPKSQSAEDIFQVVCDAVDTGEVGLWVIDSLGALLSEQEWEKEMNERTYGGIALPLTRFSKKIEMLMKRHNCTGIGINQLRDKIDSSWGGTDTPGGRSWKHSCSVRIQFSKGKYFDENGKDISRSSGEPYGNYVIADAVKNKTAPPTRHLGQYRIRYDIGIDYLTDLLDVALLYGILEQSGAWYKLIDIETGEILKDKLQGMSNVTKALTDDEELQKKIEELVDNKSKEN